MSAVARVQELRAVVSDAIRRDAPELPRLKRELAAIEISARVELAREAVGTTFTSFRSPKGATT